MFGAQTGLFSCPQARWTTVIRHLQRAANISVVILAVLWLTSCSGLVQGQPNTAAPLLVSVNPPSISVQLSQSANFTASTQNETQGKGVSWGLFGSGCSGNACGTLTNATTTTVTYSAPATMPNPGSITLTATSVADNSKQASATITLTSTPPPISVSVSPTSPSLQVSTSANFAAAVQNDSQAKGVSWTLSGSGCSGTACGTLSNITTAE